MWLRSIPCKPTRIRLRKSCSAAADIAWIAAVLPDFYASAYTGRPQDEVEHQGVGDLLALGAGG